MGSLACEFYLLEHETVPLAKVQQLMDLILGIKLRINSSIAAI